ncbi:MAG: BREX-3 system phosphatase PglZ, partial [Anaerolineae bacterium]|nr:BREX-3 system phosphatase PglZ [Anaerolineae bacterium]
ALCLIDNKMDDMIHDATLGAPDFYASLRVWLEEYGRRVEKVIAGLLARGFTVYLTSDHGHVEARGFGQPSEGLTVDTRGKR